MHATNQRRRGRDNRGQSLVEFAMLLPLFLVIVFAVVDFGMGLRSWISITNSAREGARIGAVHGSCDAIRDQVKDTSGGLVTSDDQIDIEIDGTLNPATCEYNAGDSVIVTVQYEYELVSPLGGMLNLIDGSGLPSSITIESASDMRAE